MDLRRDTSADGPKVKYVTAKRAMKHSLVDQKNEL